jgi:hypothetical protein
MLIMPAAKSKNMPTFFLPFFLDLLLMYIIVVTICTNS